MALKFTQSCEQEKCYLRFDIVKGMNIHFLLPIIDGLITDVCFLTALYLLEGTYNELVTKSWWILLVNIKFRKEKLSAPVGAF